MSRLSGARGEALGSGCRGRSEEGVLAGAEAKEWGSYCKAYLLSAATHFHPPQDGRFFPRPSGARGLGSHLRARTDDLRYPEKAWEATSWKLLPVLAARVGGGAGLGERWGWGGTRCERAVATETSCLALGFLGGRSPATGRGYPTGGNPAA